MEDRGSITGGTNISHGGTGSTDGGTYTRIWGRASELQKYLSRILKIDCLATIAGCVTALNLINQFS